MSGRKPKVLIIDDNETVLSVSAAGLETDGYVVSTAIDAKTGMQKIEAEHPDIIILDIWLPDRNGFEVCKEIRSNPATADTPIIIITGDQTVDIEKGFAVGADDCIMKPLDLGYLAMRINKLIKRKGRVLVVDDDRQICLVVKNLLEKNHYEAHVLYEGSELVKTIHEVQPDLILLDVSLPVGPDGVEMCKLLKSDLSTKEIPIIMLTANEFVDSIEKCFGYGAEDYIFKPFDIADLLLKIKKYIDFDKRDHK